jgi:hypothetical protein
LDEDNFGKTVGEITLKHEGRIIEPIIYKVWHKYTGRLNKEKQYAKKCNIDRMYINEF